MESVPSWAEAFSFWEADEAFPTFGWQVNALLARKNNLAKEGPVSLTR